jgi:mono/diheme cytochrome c family protein
MKVDAVTTLQATPSRAMISRVLIAAAVALMPVAAAHAQTAQARPAPPRTGAQIFSTTCAACHQAQGEGTDVYPPLAGSEMVKGDESRVVRIILHGLTGDVEVQGQVYSGAMPPWGPTLTDAEIAAVATYIRSSWGNNALPITTATVAQTRAVHAGRTTPWTVPELLLIKVGQKK